MLLLLLLLLLMPGRGCTLEQRSMLWNMVIRKMIIRGEYLPTWITIILCIAISIISISNPTIRRISDHTGVIQIRWVHESLVQLLTMSPWIIEIRCAKYNIPILSSCCCCRSRILRLAFKLYIIHNVVYLHVQQQRIIQQQCGDKLRARLIQRSNRWSNQKLEMCKCSCEHCTCCRVQLLLGIQRRLKTLIFQANY